MNIKQLATNFDVLYRRSPILQGMWVFVTKKFNQSYKHDVWQAINDLKQIQSQFKPLIQDVLKMDKEIKITYDKYDRQKEKTLRASKEYEESAITLEVLHWNKEYNMEQTTKAQYRLNSQLQYKQENESTLRQTASIYNQTFQSYYSSLQNGLQQLTTLYNQIFAIAKVSEIINLGYCNEDFGLLLNLPVKQEFLKKIILKLIVNQILHFQGILQIKSHQIINQTLKEKLYNNKCKLTIQIYYLQILNLLMIQKQQQQN